MEKSLAPKEYITESAEETRQLGVTLAREFRGGTVVAFEGDLGAGKTTLSQGILEGLGAEGPYTSPTFVIMKHYDLSQPSKGGIRRVYHVDAYRIGAKEIAALGWDEWVHDPEGVVILEWPERISEVLPEHMLRVSLRWLDDAKRRIEMQQS